jgi:hypothetical protein
MVAMVNDYVRDEALAREAKRLGLDEGDTIVTRRLAQKMTFMVADLARTETPDDAVSARLVRDPCRPVHRSAESHLPARLL